MIVLLGLFLHTLSIDAMQEEVRETLQEVRNFSDLTDNQKSYFGAIVGAMTNPSLKTYFLRGIQKNETIISNDDLVQTLSRSMRQTQEKQVTQNFILSLFQICYMHLGVLCSERVPIRSDAEKIITWNYIDCGFQDNVELKDFYQILYTCSFMAPPLIEATINNFHKRGIQDVNENKNLALKIVDCFLIDVLIKAPFKPDSSSEGETKTYKSLYEDFLSEIRFVEPEKLDQPIITMVRLLGVKALCKKLMLNIIQGAQEEETSIIKKELSSLYQKTIKTKTVDIPHELLRAWQQLGFISNTEQDIIIGGDQIPLDYFLLNAKHFFNNIQFTQIIDEILPRESQESLKQLGEHLEQLEARVKNLKERSRQFRVKLEQIHRDTTQLRAIVVEQILRRPENGNGIRTKTFLYKTMLFSSVLFGIGSIIWYIRSHPRLFVDYPLLKKIVFPFFVSKPKKEVKQSFLKKLIVNVMRRAKGKQK